ncbi:(acyl-carrier-protein) phosphodiesterase [Alishewanella aestuarii B11]|uniref:FMN dependent NADH:quinone oxidoreductase n=1 Tax=Alishewanella aestuarii B11 TaxID=1197174 RepID=J2IC86_9ALTE|nr:NAD(P)H-dependent oxidoreductase [Alishewanella aestuarii]EJI84274.1 (acyl-carrier-protein) phosphodiesterase [Alishewanella aestuarii B11]
MKNILVINSSISGSNGNSNKLVQFLLAQLSGAQVTEIDLNAQPLPHLEMSEIGAWMTPAAERSSEQQVLAAYSDELIAKVEAADAIVFGVPMYNFALPSQLKALLDRLARAGVTFKYTETGPVGLLKDKPVIFALARGGIYANTPADSQVPFLKTFFNFIGLTQLHFVYAEGLNMGPEAAEEGLTGAQQQLTELAKRLFI